MDLPCVLVVQHEVGAPAGWFGDALQDNGCALTVATPYDGSPLPGLDGFAGLVVLGGAVDSWDDAAAPWLPATRALVARAAREGVATLGICLGHQIAAHALGGRAGRNPGGRALGVEPMGWLPEAGKDPLMGPLLAPGHVADRALHWNRDVVLDLPPGATPLARSRDGAVQAARLADSVWGVQCHPEVDAAIVDDWRRDEWHVLPAEDRELTTALVNDVRGQEQSLRAAWWPLADQLARLVREGPGAA